MTQQTIAMLETAAAARVAMLAHRRALISPDRTEAARAEKLEIAANRASGAAEEAWRLECAQSVERRWVKTG